MGVDVVRQGMVEGRPVEILLDTGSARTLVRKELVPVGKVLEGRTVVVRCAHGESVRYPVADLELTIGGWKIKVKAGVSDRLPVQLLLGRDVPKLFNILASSSTSTCGVSDQLTSPAVVDVPPTSVDEELTSIRSS